MKKTVNASLMLILIIFCCPTAATAFRLTPYNAVKFVYSNIKRMRIRPLLRHSRGPELKKLKRTLKNLQKQRNSYWQLKKQANELQGFSIRIREVYEKIAAVYYYWKIVRRIPVKPGSHLTKKVIVRLPFKTLLRKFKGRWYIVATRSMKPVAEFGPQDYRKKMKKKNGGKKKRKSKVMNF